MKKNSKAATVFLLLFLFGIFSSFFIYYHIEEEQSLVQKEKFKQQVSDFFYAINQRYLRNEILLQGCAGFVQASDYVSKEEWSLFIEALNLNKTFPAIQWIGLAKSLKNSEELAVFAKTFLEKEKTLLKPWPASFSPEEAIAPLIYIYPKAYEKLIGYNLLSSFSQKNFPEAQEAFTVLDPIQINPGKINRSQNLITFPIRDSAAKGHTFWGWISATLDTFTMIDEVMKGINFDGVNIQIFHGNSTSLSDLVFEKMEGLDPNPIFKEQKLITIGAKELTFSFFTNPKYRKLTESPKPAFILLALISFNLFLLFLVYRFIYFKKVPFFSEKAMGPSDTSILNASLQGLIVVDLEGKILEFNKSAERILGYNASEVKDLLKIEVFFEEESLKQRKEEFSTILKKELVSPFDVLKAQAEKNIANQTLWTFLKKDRVKVPVAVTVTGIEDANQKLAGYLVVLDEKIA